MLPQKNCPSAEDTVSKQQIIVDCVALTIRHVLQHMTSEDTAQSYRSYMPSFQGYQQRSCSENRFNLPVTPRKGSAFKTGSAKFGICPMTSTVAYTADTVHGYKAACVILDVCPGSQAQHMCHCLQN